MDTTHDPVPFDAARPPSGVPASDELTARADSAHDPADPGTPHRLAELLSRLETDDPAAAPGTAAEIARLLGDSLQELETGT